MRSGLMAQVRAAQYIRMSREHQRYSPENQRATIASYADARGFEVVRTFLDSGRSGLTLRGREGLKSLLQIVISGEADFDAILVLDVSRWGRFQDTDQAAHYEFLCREAGVAVHYCTEGFENDLTSTSSLLKNIKRVMAGEFSRDLGRKVHQGQLNGARRGFKQGGAAPFGTRRVQVNERGEVQRVLRRGEWKALTTDRVVLAPGPPEEVAKLRQIFHWFAVDRLSYKTICGRLDAENLVFEDGRRMTPTRLARLLGNELYRGVYVYNRTSQRLKNGTTRNAESEWVRTSIMEQLIDAQLFADAQVRRRSQGRLQFTDDELLEHLRQLAAGRDRISAREIDAAGPPSLATYYVRFRRMSRALRHAGLNVRYTERRRASHLVYDREVVVARLQAVLRLHGFLSMAIVDADPELPSASQIKKMFGSVVTAYRAAGWDVDRSSLRRLAVRRRWMRDDIREPWSLQI